MAWNSFGKLEINASTNIAIIVIIIIIIMIIMIIIIIIIIIIISVPRHRPAGQRSGEGGQLLLHDRVG